MFIYYKESKAP